NCWDYLTKSEREYVEIYGCWQCSDCEIPYRMEGRMKKDKWIKLAHLVIDLWYLIEKIIKKKP
ncbi:hypothetical protein LCGC14_2827390, partial [marine sediment metagenome]